MKPDNSIKTKNLVINNVFVGGYGHNKGNLPHEMINFFKADNDNFYIYITPYGVLDAKYSACDIEGVLFVRSVGDSLVEVLAKAVFDQDDSAFFTQGVKLSNSNDYSIKIGKEKYTEKLEKDKQAKGDITYGGKSLSKIHDGNVKDNEIFVSMRVKEICLPKKAFYLTNKKSKAIRDNIKYIGEEEQEGKKIANQSMKVYYPDKIDDKENQSYNELKIVFDGNETFAWQSPENTPKYNSKNIVNDDNFFKATRQQDNEVMFSNMLYYYFINYPKLTQGFVKNFLDITLSDNFTVEREKERMDVRIIDDQSYIILENKIKSSINGMHTKVEDLKANEKKSNEKKTSYTYTVDGFRADENGKYISQLSVYYQKAEDKNKHDNKPRKIYGRILTPNYNAFDNEELEKYSCGEKYSCILYDKIHSFFIKNKHLTSNDKYIDDFINAMQKHTTATDNEYRNELMQRLKYRIENTK